MKKESKFLIVIPARGGSKRIPGKNMKLLNEKPLIQYTIEAAREIFDDDVICVSTDDIVIKQFVESLGLNVPFIRPENISSDSASSSDVILHAMDYYRTIGYIPDIIVLLQPTSPFRNRVHIEEAIKLLDVYCDSVFSVSKFSHNPSEVIFSENSNGFLEGIQYRKESVLENTRFLYKLNGAIYVYKAALFEKRKFKEPKHIRKYLMGDFFSLDIDTENDWYIAESGMYNLNRQK